MPQALKEVSATDAQVARSSETFKRVCVIDTRNVEALAGSSSRRRIRRKRS
jgi:hypothetical protein